MNKLYFGDLFIGDIVHTGNDFPWSHGKFHLRLDYGSESSAHIIKYIAHSIRLSDFYEEQTESNPLSDWEDQLLKEEIEFDALIHSDKWSILHPNGDIIKILIPVFHSEGTIGWRLA